MNAKRLAIINTISVVVVLVVNYLSQTGAFNDRTVGELSEEYNNLFTPAGYAFSIWGVIFLGLVAYVIYQLLVAFKYRKEIKEHKQTGYWFAIVNFANAGWVLAWLYEYTGLSVLIMLLILTGLVVIVIKTNMEKWDAPLSIIAFIWWPVCLYAGWIAVATVANISSYLSKLNWNGGIFSEVQWTVIMIIVATGVNYFMVRARNMREFAMVGVWALIAILVRHHGVYPAITWAAGLCSGFLLVIVTIHAYRNRATNPAKKLLS